MITNREEIIDRAFGVFVRMNYEKARVAASMKRILELIGDNHSPHDCSLNSYYFHFLSQVRMYYPDIKQKIERIFQLDYELWEKVIQKAKESGEIILRMTNIIWRKSYGRRKKAEKSGATRT